MIRDVLEMAARCEELRAGIRATLPPDVAEAVIVEAELRSVYLPTRLDDALRAARNEALSGRLEHRVPGRP